MPSTIKAGPKTRAKPQPRKPAVTRKPAVAKAPVSQPSAPPENDALFDDGAASAASPIVLAVPSEPSPPVLTPNEAEGSGVVQEEQTAPIADLALTEPAAPDSTLENANQPAETAPVQSGAATFPAESEEEGEGDLSASSGTPTRVRLGHAIGMLHRVPLATVQMLAVESGSRIEALQTSPSIVDLQNRMRATEGRCAPIFFTLADGDDRPFLFSGVEAIAAAVNLGLADVSVVIVNADDAEVAQRYLAGRFAGKATSAVDDLLEVLPD